MSAPVRLFGYPVDRHGCDPQSLERLVLRALNEGVRLVPDARPGLYEARRPGSPSRYATSRTRCTCRAGQLSIPCKHRALVVLVSAILDGRPRGP